MPHTEVLNKSKFALHSWSYVHGAKLALPQKRWASPALDERSGAIADTSCNDGKFDITMAKNSVDDPDRGNPGQGLPDHRPFARVSHWVVPSITN